MSKRRTPDQWQGLIDQQRHSGLSALQFCKQQGIGYASFRSWRKRLCESPVSDSTETEQSDFLDLSALMGASPSCGPGWTIVLSLGNGVELRLSQNG
ncbi:MULTISPECIES: hypothetical protein [Gammaproteobacteria]|jgi:hypothetical protein|uniref:IS66 family insertion sequence element accessory protein TnpA n=1 Tax=Gammaproteobacteria TaxID=1236 RepID=UPI000B3FDCBF|nr:hypothetical protein [Salinicola salarius]